jgi:hypothetical protein
VVRGDKNARLFYVNGTVLSAVINSITRAGTTATVTTAVAHGLITGNIVDISGCNEANFNGTDLEVTLLGANQFSYAVANSGAAAATGTMVFVSLTVGNVIRVTQTGKSASQELMVKEINADGGGISGATATIVLEPANISEIGYQALALQDSYTAGSVARIRKNPDGTPRINRSVQLIAATAGTWANSDGIKSGLIVKIAPGSKADTKKMLVYEESALVESIDNLSTDSTSVDYYVTRINGLSSYVAIPTDDTGTPTGIITTPDPAGTAFHHPANTVYPWNLTRATQVNFAAFGYITTEYDYIFDLAQEDIQLGIGFNGEGDLPASVIIGTIDPNTDEATGLKLFLDTEVVEVDVLCVPGCINFAVQQELAIIAKSVNALSFGDIPDSTDANEPVLNLRQAVDWHNGAGLFSSTRARIDSANLMLFFNWFKMVDPFTTNQIFMPPTVGVLKLISRTFDRDKPWSAFAGENRGIIDEALAVRFPKIGLEAKASSYGNGQSVNSILLLRGRIMLYGDRTMQVAESKLSAAHSVILTNYLVRGMATIARRFVFDPNDTELLIELNLAFTKLLESIKSERGIEDYSLVCDSTNNTADTRNARNVIVDISFIPVDVVERIFINATVRESGAVLNAVQ